MTTSAPRLGLPPSSSIPIPPISQPVSHHVPSFPTAPISAVPPSSSIPISADALLTPSKDPFNTIKNYVAIVEGDKSTAQVPKLSSQPPPTSFFDGLTVKTKLIQPKLANQEEDTAFVSFFTDEVVALSAYFVYTLVGKFSNGVPGIGEVAPAIKDLKLKGRFTVSFMDYRHVIIRLFTEKITPIFGYEAP